MTREERLKWLKQIEKDIHVCSLESTLADDMKSCAIHSTIEELEQEPCEDAVSRQAVFETIDDCNSDGLKGIFCSYDDGERFKGYIKKLPPVLPTRKKGK